MKIDSETISDVLYALLSTVALICLVVLLAGCASNSAPPAKQDIPPGIVLLKKSF